MTPDQKQIVQKRSRIDIVVLCIQLYMHHSLGQIMEGQTILVMNHIYTGKWLIRLGLWHADQVLMAFHLVKNRFIYNWMHSSRENFTLHFIWVPPIPKEMQMAKYFWFSCQYFLHMYHHMPIELEQNAETCQGQKYQKNHTHMYVEMGLGQWRNNMSHPYN